MLKYAFCKITSDHISTSKFLVCTTSPCFKFPAEPFFFLRNGIDSMANEPLIFSLIFPIFANYIQGAHNLSSFSSKFNPSKPFFFITIP